jgi:hypothetical protein
MKNIEILENAKKSGFKISIYPPGGDPKYKVDILRTDNYIIVHAYNKPSNYNMKGNNYKFYHSINTGEYIPIGLLPSGALQETILSKEPFTIKEYNKLIK